MNHKNIVSLFVLILFAVSAFAQTQKIEGVVADSAGLPVAGATVVLRDKATKAERSTTTTNAEGAFSFDSGCTDPCDVIVKANGFASSTADVASSAAPLNVIIEPQPIKETVNVTAARAEMLTSETAVPVSVVDREEIDRKAVNTIGDIFRSLPGTSTVNEGAFQVRPRIRGLDSNRVLVLVDGERLNNSRTSTSQSGIETGLVETSQIETLEVVRGSGSVLYGTDALAGTINIITRDTPTRRDGGLRFGATLNTFYSSNENGRRGNLAVTGSNKFFAFRIAQSLDRFENYFAGSSNAGERAYLRGQEAQITDDNEVLNSQSHSSNSQATLRFFINDTNTLKVNYERRRGSDIGSAGLAGANTGIPGLVGVFNAFFPFNNRDKFNFRYDVSALTDNLQRISAKAFYQTQHRSFTNIVTVPPFLPFFPGVYQYSDTVTDTKTTGFDLQSDWLFRSHNVIAGASWFRDDNSDRRLVISSATSYSPNRTFRNSRSVPDASLSNLAFFAQDDYKLSKRLRIVGGVRFDRFSTTSKPTADFSLDPRLTAVQIEELGLTGLGGGLSVDYTSVTGDVGAVYQITRNLNFSARVGRSFRTPNISERFFTDPGSAEGFLVGNPSLEPETGINFDTSLRIQTSRFKASATYFNNYFKNFLTTVAAVDSAGHPIQILTPGRPPTQIYQTRNLRTARIEGFEGEIEAPFKIKLGYLTPYGNFSYLRGEDVRRNVALDSISPFRTNVGFRWQNFGKSYYFDYNARIVGKQERVSPEFPAANGGATYEPGFVTHNLGGGYYLRRERFDFNVHLGVSNLMNRFYSEQFVLAPARGRSFTIGTTISIK